MRKLLKILNPFIAMWNMFKYESHLEVYRYSKSDEYMPYDFEKNDTKYF